MDKRYVVANDWKQLLYVFVYALQKSASHQAFYPKIVLIIISIRRMKESPEKGAPSEKRLDPMWTWLNMSLSRSFGMSNIFCNRISIRAFVDSVYVLIALYVAHRQNGRNKFRLFSVSAHSTMLFGFLLLFSQCACMRTCMWLQVLLFCFKFCSTYHNFNYLSQCFLSRNIRNGPIH